MNRFAPMVGVLALGVLGLGAGGISGGQALSGEKPYLRVLEIRPQMVSTYPGIQEKFKVNGLDQRGRNFKVKDVSWSLPDGGGQMRGSEFTPGVMPGRYRVVATVGSVSRVAFVEVRPEPADPAIARLMAERDAYHELFSREHDLRVIAEAQLEGFRKKVRETVR